MASMHPSREECFVLLKNNKTPSHVVRHCVKVTETALKIAEALNKKGFHLDLGLIQGAGLIHDIARVEDKHWEVGAKIASGVGYHDEAEIIKQHMSYHCDPYKADINELDIICLSDRMVKEDEYVGLETRMQYILDKFEGNEEAIERISSRIKDNRVLIKRIEKIIGKSLDALMK